MTDTLQLPRTLESGEINAELIAAQRAAYYAERCAYDPRDPRKIIGRYSATGEIVPFAAHKQ